MDVDELVDAYLRAVERRDADVVISLFSSGGIVHSPLYGSLPAATFYPQLFADMSSAALTLRCAMRGTDPTGTAVVGFWFHFAWRLPTGTDAPFEVVDVARLDASGRITELTIVYDTVDVRPAFEAATGRPSWRDPPVERD